jgi:hypothetical protein
MTNNVFFGEVDKLDANEIRQNPLSFNQSAAFPRRKVHLGHVAGDDRFRTKADAR